MSGLTFPTDTKQPSNSIKVSEGVYLDVPIGINHSSDDSKSYLDKVPNRFLSFVSDRIGLLKKLNEEGRIHLIFELFTKAMQAKDKDVGLFDIKNKKFTVRIFDVDHDHLSLRFKVTEFGDVEVWGDMTCLIIDADDGNLDDYLLNYGINQEIPILKIYVDFLSSVGRDYGYKGVGTALMQVAMELGYLIGCEGRLVLSAAFDSHGFYYKLGLRAVGPQNDDDTLLTHSQWNEAVEKAIQNGKVKTTIKTLLKESSEEQEYGLPMFLPLEQIELWRSKIQSAPILYMMKEYLKS